MAEFVMAESVVRVECLVVCCAVVAAAVVDLRLRVIPNACPAAIVLARVAALALLWACGQNPGPLLRVSLAGATITGLPLVLAAQFTGGVGWGDVKLLTSLGFILGWQRGVTIVFVSCTMSVLLGCILYLVQRRRDPCARLMSTTVPMAPQILGSLLVMLIFFRL